MAVMDWRKANERLQGTLAAGTQALAKARKLAQVWLPDGATTPGQGNTRFVPPAPHPPVGEEESEDTWGFADTRFDVQPDNGVILTGARYSMSNELLPNLIPWINGVMQIDAGYGNDHPYVFPPNIPPPQINKKFLNEIKTFLQPDQISDDGVARLRRGHGQTQEEMYAIKYASLPRIPDLIVWPKAEDEVSLLVAAAKSHGAVLIPYGGGTNVTDALRCPENEKRTIVSVDMRKMNRILWIDPVNRMARIEAGAVGRHIMSQLAEYGFTIGHEPDSVEFSTLGGWVATHASGMKKNKYGNIEDIVLDVNVVSAAGVLTRSQVAPRESVGIDPRLIVFGSEGKLGIITSAVVKLFPVPEVQRYGSVIFPNFDKGVGFMYELTQSGMQPASVRLVDNLQFQFSQALKPASKGWKVQKSKVEKIFVTKIRGFDPQQMVACTLVFEGSEREVAAQESNLYAIAAKYSGMPAGGENGARGYQLTYAIAYIRDFVMNHWVLAESFETSVPWSNVLALCENTKQFLFDECARRGIPGKPFVTCRVTQVYDTGVAVYFYFAFYYKGVENAVETYLEIEKLARDVILSNGGSLSHHHGIGKLRRQFLPQIMSQAALSWNARAKLALDPDNIFGCANQIPDPSVEPS